MPNEDQQVPPIRLEALAGVLGEKTRFRVVVDGPYGVREIAHLIELLELQKRILEEDDVGPDQAPAKEQP